MTIPNVFPFPIRQAPTWTIWNADNWISLPLMGQFNTDVTWIGGKPIWVKKPAIAGGEAWMQYVGHGVDELRFTFHAISNDVLDFYPSVAWEKLKSLMARDDNLGRPPLIWFIHGTTITQGYITKIGDPTVQYWESQAQIIRFAREIGPVEVTITIKPKTEYTLSLSTSFTLHTGDDFTYEDAAHSKYGDPRYGASLRDYNQGVTDNDQVELPRKSHRKITKNVDVGVYLDVSSTIEGL